MIQATVSGADAKRTTATSARRRFQVFVPRPAATIRLYCFPFAGGSASSFRTWALKAPDHIEIASCQPPGRHDRLCEEMPRDVIDLAGLLASDLQDEHDGRPFAFFGHSFGALVAYQLAVELQSHTNLQPSWLGLSAHAAPQRAHRSTLHTLDDAQLVRTLTDFGGIPETVAAHSELLEIVLPPLRNDLRLAETYRHNVAAKVVLPAVDVFGATDDVLAPPDSLDGWKSLFTCDVSIELHHGGHFFLWSAMHAILGRLTDRLSLVRQGVGPFSSFQELP